MNKNIVDELAKGAVESFNLGVKVERDRIVAFIEPHIAVCNFEAATGNACDVCFWVRDTLKQIKGQVWK